MIGVLERSYEEDSLLVVDAWDRDKMNKVGQAQVDVVDALIDSSVFSMKIPICHAMKIL